MEDIEPIRVTTIEFRQGDKLIIELAADREGLPQDTTEIFRRFLDGTSKTLVIRKGVIKQIIVFSGDRVENVSLEVKPVRQLRFEESEDAG